MKKRDENQIAYEVLQEVIRRDAERDGIPQKPILKEEKIPYRVKAGSKGGTSRAKRLSPKKRKEIAQKAAQARWQK